MRSWFGALAVLVTCAVSCVGAAGADPGAPGTALSADRYGVVAGFPDAPVQLEFFCDPQCPDCAKFESSSGAGLGRHLTDGQVVVTYRWLTFLDDRRHNDTSTRVSNALMLAADPATLAAAYQGFVVNLYRNGGNPDAEAIAATARKSGLPEQVTERIAAGDPGTDTIAMNALNRVLLQQANPEKPGTPTVYDLRSNTVVDTTDVGWLDRLVQAG